MTFDPVTSPALATLESDARAVLAVVKAVVLGLDHDPEAPYVRSIVADALRTATTVTATLTDTNQWR